MTEIEFLDPGPAQLPPADPGPQPPATVRDPRVEIRRALPTALWLLAAALTLCAPFNLVYVLSLRVPGSGHQAVSSDGWGRLHNSSVPFSQHDTRYGIVEYVAAGLLLLAAGFAALAGYRRSLPPESTTRSRIASAAAGLTGTALLGGALASAVLYVDSLTDNINAQIHRDDVDPGFGPSPSQTTLSQHLGWMVWLTAIAIGCGVAALAAVAARPPTLPQQAALEAPPPLVVVQPDPRDELLDTD
jgi:hypothetical protein